MEKVIIIGGGFGGLETALRLKKLNKKIDITLINDSDCFTFIPAIYESAACVMPTSNVCLLISSLLEKNNIHFYNDFVKKVDINNKTISTKNIKSISFDYLVLAVGSDSNFHNIYGAKKNTLPLKNHHDADLINEKIQYLTSTQKSGNIVVCGGGLSGVEFASTLSDYLANKKFHITIVDSKNTILDGMPTKAIELASKILHKKRISILTNTPITEITRNKIYSTKFKISFDLAIWCGGIENNILVKRSKFRKSSKIGFRAKSGGGIIVNDYLQSINSPFVFALGDCVTNKNNSILKTAQNAVYEASFVAYNINAAIRHKELKAFKTKPNKVYCSLGKNNGFLISNNQIKSGKNVRIKKEQLEKKYLNNLKKNILSKNNIYD